jgi:muramoyltetrapeptide carboxypeptidase
MPISLLQDQDPKNVDLLFKVLFGEGVNYTVSEAHSLNRPGTGQGKVVGGNLSLLQTLTGTATDLHTDGCILFMEDLDEYLYHVDRMMMHLKRAGKLTRLAGLIVGGFTQMKDNTVPFGQSAYEIIAETVREYGYPVVFGFPCGHQARNYPLIVGRTARLEVTAGGPSTLKY